MQLYSDKGRKFQFRPMQENLERLEGVCKIRKTAIHLQADGIVERYVNTVGRWSLLPNMLG
jgi:hypothetical protein